MSKHLLRAMYATLVVYTQSIRSLAFAVTATSRLQCIIHSFHDVTVRERLIATSLLGGLIVSEAADKSCILNTTVSFPVGQSPCHFVVHILYATVRRQKHVYTCIAFRRIYFKIDIRGFP